VWETSKIARIDPKSGKLLGWIDFKTLVDDETARTEEANVLNGIAYDAASNRLFVTGKKWSRLFEVKVKPQK
jgi:glutaminyl-peptide cyclotransferase